MPQAFENPRECLIFYIIFYKISQKFGAIIIITLKSTFNFWNFERLEWKALDCIIKSEHTSFQIGTSNSLTTEKKNIILLKKESNSADWERNIYVQM